MRNRRAILAAAGVAVLLLATPADAKVKCKRVGAADRTLKVTFGSDTDEADVSLDGVEITVANSLDKQTLISCDADGGLVPTVNNTDLVKVRDKTKKGRTPLAVTNYAAFIPGATDAGDDAGSSTVNEVEFDINLGGDTQDVLVLRGNNGADNTLVMGRNRANPNPLELFPDSDIFYKGVIRIVAVPGNGSDGIFASGSAVTGEPLRKPLGVVATGGSDMLVGGDGPDNLLGGAGEDSLQGEGGDDRLDGGLESDLIDGGDGIDRALWFDGSGDYSVDIGTGGNNDGGPSDGPVNQRDEVTSSIEDIFVATDGEIQLFGDSDPNFLQAFGDVGADTMVSGLAGNDHLIGGDSEDTLVGGLGVDRLFGVKGDDTLLAEDGIRDRRIDCGKGGGDFAEVDPEDPKAKSC